MNADLVGDLLVICNALAAPLANLFAFLAHGHPQCTFVDQAHLALYADFQFWQYGLLAFCSVCCACNINKLLADKRAADKKADPAKQVNDPAGEVNALTLMQTVIMSFARGMIHGQQELPINDMYVYFPVQVLQSLVQSIGQNHFRPATLDAGLGYRTTKDQLQDNPYLVVGAYRKTIAYEGEPAMPDTQWAARAFGSEALDPTLGQSMAFPSSARMLLRIEVPLWSDVATAKHPPPKTNANESEAESSRTGTQERLP